MRQFINISALVVFVWLLLDALNIPTMLLGFLLTGEIPLIGITLSPAVMLAITTTSAGIIVLELLARRISIIRRIRYHLASTIKRERLPKRRLGRA